MAWLGFSLLSGGTPDYAKEAQKAEDQRQQRIKQGTANINKQFSGFGKDFYNAREQAYIDYAMPKLGEQYRQTKNQIGFNLANRGSLGGSAARTQWSDLNRTNLEARQGIVDTGISQAQDLQRQVESQRNTLLNQLYQSADPAQAQQAAIATAASMQAPSTFAPLVNQFSGLLNQYYISQLINQQKNATGPVYGGGSGGYGYGAGFAPLGPVSTEGY